MTKLKSSRQWSECVGNDMRLWAGSWTLIVLIVLSPLFKATASGIEFVESFTQAEREAVPGFSASQIVLLKTALFEEPSKAKFDVILVAARNERAMALIDNTVLKIFTSPAAIHALCPFLPTTKNAVFNLGVSEDAGEKVAAVCAREGIKPYGGLTPEQLRIKSRRTLVLIETTAEAPVESWSMLTGETILFSHGGLTEFALLRGLLHEYYVTFDKYWLLSAGTAPRLLQGMEVKARSEAEAAQFFKVVWHPFVRGSFLMSRAYTFEERVLREVYPEIQLTSAKVSCWESVKALSKEIVDNQAFFLDAEYLLLKPSQRLPTAGLVSLTPDIIDRLAEAEKQVGLEFHVQGRTQSLCQFLSEPALGTESSFFTQGPRIRIGTGTERTRVIESVWPMSLDPKFAPKESKTINVQGLLKPELDGTAVTHEP